MNADTPVVPCNMLWLRLRCHNCISEEFVHFERRAPGAKNTADDENLYGRESVDAIRLVQT